MASVTKNTVLAIKRKAMTLGTPEWRQPFAMAVVDPPVTARDAGPSARSRSTAFASAFWDGYDNKPARRLSGELKPWRLAGQFRRSLEDGGKMPRIGAVELDPATGEPVETELPPDMHFEDEGFIRSLIGADGACYVLYDTDNGGDWIGGDDRWTVCRFLRDGRNTGIVSFPTRYLAEAAMADEKAGRFTGIDFGQDDGVPAP